MLAYIQFILQHSFCESFTVSCLTIHFIVLISLLESWDYHISLHLKKFLSSQHFQSNVEGRGAHSIFIITAGSTSILKLIPWYDKYLNYSYACNEKEFNNCCMCSNKSFHITKFVFLFTALEKNTFWINLINKSYFTRFFPEWRYKLF